MGPKRCFFFLIYKIYSYIHINVPVFGVGRLGAGGQIGSGPAILPREHLRRVVAPTAERVRPGVRVANIKENEKHQSK